MKTVRRRDPIGRKYGWDLPGDTVERICRKTNRRILEIDSSQVSDIRLLVQKE